MSDETREQGAVSGERTNGTKAGMTAGEWHTDGSRIFQQVNAGGRKTWIAEVFTDCGSASARANAKAIAALPFMVEVLRRVRGTCQEFTTDKECDADPYDTMEAMLVDATDALKKAGLL